MKEVRNIAIANGIVSNNGASELSSPSLFSPRLRFMNEPERSPNIQETPRIKPIVNAANELPKSPSNNQTNH